MFRQFKFEEHLYQGLDQVPVSTQFKLEALGFPFPLESWNQLPLEERWVLCHLPIRSRGDRECYSRYLAYLFRRLGMSASLGGFVGTSPERKPWEDLQRLPPEVVEKMKAFHLPLYWSDWIKLDDMERYAIYKLCRENTNSTKMQQAFQELLGRSLPSPAV